MYDIGRVEDPPFEPHIEHFNAETKLMELEFKVNRTMDTSTEKIHFEVRTLVIPVTLFQSCCHGCNKS